MPRSSARHVALAAHVALVVLGVTLVLAGIVADRDFRFAVGVVVAVVAALGPDATRISLEGMAVRLTLERCRRDRHDPSD